MNFGIANLFFFSFFFPSEIRLYVSFELSLVLGLTENPLRDLKNYQKL